MPKNWDYTKTDRELSKELQKFIPEKVFDAHAHLYRVKDLPSPGEYLKQGPDEATVALWRRRLEKQVGSGRLAGGLFIPMPHGAYDKVNDFLVSQVNKVQGSKGLIVIGPDYPEKKVRAYLENSQIVGFKPYHTFSKEKPTFQSSLPGYLPDWAWKIANEKGLVITLHMVKDLALSDPDNQRQIRKNCLKYPNAKLILAHAARGFHSPNTVKGISVLRGLENVFFDTAAVCEPAAFYAILQEFGPRKLLWGSDFPVSEEAGRCVTVGRGFVWLRPDTVKWEKVSPACDPVLVGLESLRALQEAAGLFGLNREDLNDIFCGNATRLLGLKAEPSGITQELYRHAKDRMPGGTQLLSKRPEMQAPNQWPAYFREARGCEVWDLDGRHYYDMSTNAIGACLLGFRDPDVSAAVRRRINLGSMCTLNPPEEVELADRLCEIHPWAEQVRFSRSGGEIAAVAVRIARATTDRSLVAVCGYHGWHDWYLAANLGESDALRGHLLPGLSPLGVPTELRGTALPFTFNNREELQKIIDEHGSRLAAVIMEPCRGHNPEPGFLEFVRDVAHRNGALLIFDEISIGWRFHFGGAHLKLGVNPDIAIFAKALGNGHPIGAVIGTKEAMSGGHDSFISSTYWTESVGPAAALATLKKMSEIDVPGHAAHIGESVLKLWKDAGIRHGVSLIFDGGYPCWAHFRFDHPLAEELRTLYVQSMLERGFLAGVSVYPTLAHTDKIVSLYGEAIDEVFAEIAKILENNQVKERLKGPVAHSGFRRLL